MPDFSKDMETSLLTLWLVLLVHSSSHLFLPVWLGEGKEHQLYVIALLGLKKRRKPHTHQAVRHTLTLM